MGDEWLLFDEATALFRRRLNASVGKAQAVLKAAIASDEIRHRPNEAAIIEEWERDFDIRRGVQREKPPDEYNKADLLYWLDRQSSQTDKPTPAQKNKTYRHAGDAALIKQGRKLVAGGMTKLAAAKQLASKAVGGSFDQRVERLRKLI
jgi:hypothetical protein